MIDTERAGEVAEAFRRVGRAWWLWVVLGHSWVTHGGHTNVVLAVLPVAIDVFVVVALLQLSRVLPLPASRRVTVVAAIAALAAWLDVVGHLAVHAPGPFSFVSWLVALVGLTVYVCVVRSFASAEPLTSAVVGTWNRSVRWCVAAVVLLLAAWTLGIVAFLVSTSGEVSGGTRGVVIGLGIAGSLAWVGALLSTARSTHRTRMVFDEYSSQLHGPIGSVGPPPPS